MVLKYFMRLFSWITKKITHLYQMRLHLLRQEMTLDADHDILKIVYGNKPRAILIGPAEAFDCIFLVEVVQELTELAVRYHPLLIFTEIQLYEWGFYIERYPLVEFGFLHHLNEFS